MILTRKLQAPWIWVAVIHLFSTFATYGLMLKGMPLVLLAGRFEPIYAVKYALSFSAVAIFTVPLGMIAPWLSDRIWTRWGRRKPFMVLSDSLQALCLLLLPFTANIGSILFLWAIFLIADAMDAGPRGALVWEIIPARQRARSTVFRYLFASAISVLFFTVLLGRSHDLPATGPFAPLGVSGLEILFWMGALLKAASAMLAAIGIKEVYPPNRRRIFSGRVTGEPMWRFLPRIFVKDGFIARPLWPLYLLVLASALFTIAWGVHDTFTLTQGLGYTMKDFGNLTALSMVPTLLLLPLAFLADKVDRLKLLFVAAVVAFGANFVLTVYGFAGGAGRPTFYEIVAGFLIQTSLGTILGITASLLIYDFIPRNHFGAAQIGPQLFRGLLRSGFAMLMSALLVGWSIQFLPQSGYKAELTPAPDVSEDALARMLAEAELPVAEGSFATYSGRSGAMPHRTSFRLEVPEVGAWLDQREEIRDQLDTLRGQLFLREDDQMTEKRENKARLSKEAMALSRKLAAASEEMEAKIRTALDPALGEETALSVKPVARELNRAKPSNLLALCGQVCGIAVLLCIICLEKRGRIAREGEIEDQRRRPARRRRVQRKR